VLFTGEDPQHGQELWRTDGTPAGTHLVKDIAPADLGGAPLSSLTAAGDRLYFILDEIVSAGGADESHSVLWRSDGTDAGTVRVKDLGARSSPFLAAAVGRRLFFLYGPGGTDRALWASDGTAATTVRLTPESLRIGAEFAALGSMLLFTADDGVHGLSLWKSDGTPAGTVPIAPVAGGGPVTHFTVFNNQLFYFLEGADGNEQLWRTDGSAGGTAHVADLHSRFSDENPPLLIPFAGRLYFFAQNDLSSPSSQRLWSTDGTEAGTQRVVTFGLGDTEILDPVGLFVAGGKLFISVYNSGYELWVSDGTDAGTHRIAAVGFGARDPFGQFTPVDFGGRLIFVGPGSDPRDPQVLWASDGTVAGTAPLLGANGQPIAEPMSLRLFAGRLIFVAPGPGGLVLWQSDGTAAGPQPVLTLGGVAQGFGQDLTIAGDRLYFKAYQPATGTELWALRPD
jgi:ELWxxDGT repeat protein